MLAPAGRVVVCADGRSPERVVRGAAEAALCPLERLDVIPREGASPLFAVWVLARAEEGSGPLAHTRLVMRDAGGARTPEAHAMRAFFGLGAGG